LPSFLASKKEEIAAIDLVKEGVTLSSRSSGASASGTFHLKTVKIADKETLDVGTFENVIHFETEISGFDHPDILKIANFLPNKASIWISLKPLAIVRIRLEAPATMFVKVAAKNPDTIQGPLGKFFGSASSILASSGDFSKSVDGLTDKMDVTVDLELIEQEGLTP
jgi:hypothetical protein